MTGFVMLLQKLADLLFISGLDPEKIDTIFDSINREENFHLKLLNIDTYWGGDLVEFNKIEWKRLQDIKSKKKRGKVLLLDTMGFADKRIMCGNYECNDINQVERKYVNKLLKRHFVLARFAREELIPYLITANFDLLLEGAYRLAGLVEYDVNKLSNDDTFSVIGNPTDFYKYGSGYNNSLIIKIHGCVKKYRDAVDSSKLEEYLNSIVFTYREIQNWREDSWSRDFVQNQLRTKTMVFAGYSGMDPVLHDTFRNVYDEMETKYYSKSIDKETTLSESKDIDVAPAYFLGPKGKKEFHGMEILRAASRAIGKNNPDIIDHENYLFFSVEKNSFQTIDDLFVWLYHITYRKKQRKILETDLWKTVTSLLGNQCSRSDMSKIITGFDHIVDEESIIYNNIALDETNRNEFNNIINWTYYFHPNLLREIFYGSERLAVKSFDLRSNELFSDNWYYPMCKHADWATWCVVVELALRNLAKEMHSGQKIEPLSAKKPAVKILGTDDRYSGIGLIIAIEDNLFMQREKKLHGVYRKIISWELATHSTFWDITKKKDSAFSVPDARVVWRWALGDFKTDDSKNYLGEKT